jgi:hypothetical protein
MIIQRPTYHGTVFSLTFAALAALVGIGCTKPQTMVSASDVPASQGTVKVTEGDNGNTNIALRVKHLAPPSRMAADSTVYVVWLQPHDGAMQNIGALTLNSNLEGSLDTVTPHRRFQLTVTPEPSGLAAQPSHDPVFTTTVERPD